MAAYEPGKKSGTNSFKSSGSRRLKDNSNTAPKMKRLSPSERKLNAKGAKGTMTSTKQGSGYKLTKKLKPAAMKTMVNPDLY